MQATFDILSGFRKFLSRDAHTILLGKIRDRAITGHPHNGIDVPLPSQRLELGGGGGAPQV
jgi:hypothetical protein